MTLRIDRSRITEADALHLDDDRARAASRRAQNRAVNACVNENKNGTHGPATNGVRCRHCAAVHRYGWVVVAQRGLDALDLSNRRLAPCISQRGAA